MAEPLLAIVSVTGGDQRGIVARVSTHLSEHGVNIEDIEQHVVQGLFVMHMLVDIRDSTVRLDELITNLLALGAEIGVEIKVNLHAERPRGKLGLCVTREPHCLEEICDDIESEKLLADVVCVLSNREDLREVAEARGLPFEWKPAPKEDKESHFRWMQERLEHYGAELVALARYMQIIPGWLCDTWQWKMINIHPSLLPFYPGPNAYRQAYESGARVAGCTAHYVTEDLDEGPIIFQDVFQIDSAKDTVDEVKENGRRLEGRTLSKAVRLHVNDEILVHEGKVVFRSRPSKFDKA